MHVHVHRLSTDSITLHAPLNPGLQVSGRKYCLHGVPFHEPTRDHFTCAVMLPCTFSGDWWSYDGSSVNRSSLRMTITGTKPSKTQFVYDHLHEICLKFLPFSTSRCEL